MNGEFVSVASAAREELDWGSLIWCCRPADMSVKSLVVVEVTLVPGGGHAFHKHPRQEEVVYVLEGEVEQWLEQEERILQPGDSAFIPAGMVHASFNATQRDAKLLAILGPCIGRQNGNEVVEVVDEAPWNNLR